MYILTIYLVGVPDDSCGTATAVASAKTNLVSLLSVITITSEASVYFRDVRYRTDASTLIPMELQTIIPHAPGLHWHLAGTLHGPARVPGGGPAERFTRHRCGVPGSDACAAARRLAESGMRRRPQPVPKAY
jgi:hypothetical protein